MRSERSRDQAFIFPSEDAAFGDGGQEQAAPQALLSFLCQELPDANQEATSKLLYVITQL